MIPSSDHTIKRLVFNLSYKSEDVAIHCSKKIGLICEKSIIPLLEKVLTNKFPEDTNFKFDKIEIDIGYIKEAEFDPELANRIMSALVDALQVIDLQTKFNIDGINTAADISYYLNALDQHLQMGYFPFGMDSNISLEKLLLYLLEQNESDLIQALSKHAANDSAMKRLSFSFETIKKNHPSESFAIFFTKLYTQLKTIKEFRPIENRILYSEDYNKIEINNAGLILFWPFLTRFFEISSLLKSGEFVDTTSRNRAIFLLQYLVDQNMGLAEHELVLNKILVGMPLEDYLSLNIELSENEKELANSLLKGLIENWEYVKGATPEATQISFLKRKGILLINDEGILLHIEKNLNSDILLSFIPWDNSIIQFPWMLRPINIEWY